MKKIKIYEFLCKRVVDKDEETDMWLKMIIRNKDIILNTLCNESNHYIINKCFNMKNNKYNLYFKEWENGTLFGNENYKYVVTNWRNGIWNGGTWKEGVWWKGEWKKWNMGIWYLAKWSLVGWNLEKRVLVEWYLGKMERGKKGRWYSGTWKNGTWRGGTWLDGIWKNGTWENGGWEKGTWLDGIWKNGTWENGTWEKGTWENGTWEIGKIISRKFGYIKSVKAPNIFYEIAPHSLKQKNKKVGIK